MQRAGLLVVVCVVVVCAGSGVASGLSGDLSLGATAADDWPDDSYAEVDAGTTQSGTIGASDDVDQFRVRVQKGDAVTVALDKEIRRDTEVDIDWPGGYVTLRGESVETLRRNLTVEANGYVELDVSNDDFADGGATDWSVTTAVDSGADQWNDNDYEEVGANGTYDGRITSPDDTEALRFPVEKGDVATVTLDKDITRDTEVDIDWPGGYVTLRGESVETLSRKITVEANGYVELDVSNDDFGDGWVTDWTLTTAVDPGADQWNDNDYEEVKAGNAYSGTISSPDDTESLRVPIKNGETISIALDKPILRDTEVDIDWPGGYVTLRGEEASRLNRSVTANANGYVELDVSNDDFDDGGPATWTLGIDAPPTSANTAPSAADVDHQTTVGSTLGGTFNATDPDGDTLTYEVIDDPSHGTVSVSGETFTYNPESGFAGTDAFTYEVSDGTATDTATVTITVTEETGGDGSVTILGYNPQTDESDRWSGEPAPIGADWTDASLPKDTTIYTPPSIDGPKQRINATTEYPWSAVGSLDASCSAAIVEDNHALTAAHCVYNQTTGWKTGGHRIYPGVNVDTYPFSTTSVEYIQIYERYADGNDTYDLAVLTLDENVGNRTGTFGYAHHDASSTVYTDRTHMTGYPSPNAGYVDSFFEQWDLRVDGEGTSISGLGIDDDCVGTSLCHSADTGGEIGELTVGGSSGSPVWRTNDADLPEVLSVLVRAPGGWQDPLASSIATRITEERFHTVTRMVERGNQIEIDSGNDNRPPTAAFDVTSLDPRTTGPVTFDASNSSDPDGSVSSYRWDFDELGATNVTTSTPETSHDFDVLGNHTVELTVVDDQGATATTVRNVTVRGPATASVTLSDQDIGDGDTITVDIVSLSDAGFVTLHEGNANGTLLGTSEYLEAGVNVEVAVTVGDEIAGETTVVAVPYLDVDDDETFDRDGPDERFAVDGTVDSDSAEVMANGSTTGGQHESGVSQALFDAVAGADGTLDRIDVIDTVGTYLSGESVDGESVSRQDVLALVQYYILQ